MTTETVEVKSTKTIEPTKTTYVNVTSPSLSSSETGTPEPTKFIPASTPTSSASTPRGVIAYAYGKRKKREIYIFDLDNEKETRLTYNDFWDEAPSFSPDGSRIVFSSYRNDGWQLYIYNLRSGAETQITNFKDQARFPKWSPVPGDSRIVFEGRKGSTGNFRNNVWIVNSDGNNLQQLTNSNADSRPIWTGDGKGIIFGRATRDTTKDGRISASDNLDIYMFDINRSDTQQITNTPGFDEFSFAVSSINNLIVYCNVRDDVTGDGHQNLDDSEDLFIINTSGSDKRFLDFGGQATYSPTWSPDEEWIAVTVFWGSSSEIWLYQMDTGDIYKLTSKGPYYHPDWSN